MHKPTICNIDTGERNERKLINIPVYRSELTPKTELLGSIDVQAHHSDVATLNPEQRAFFDHMHHHTINKITALGQGRTNSPCRVFLSGGAGTVSHTDCVVW
jgi:hypothetical protein